MYIIEKRNHGTDGWDAKSEVYATADTIDEAYLHCVSLGHHYEHHGAPIWLTNCLDKMLYHRDESKRYTMGCITYTIRKAPEYPNVKTLKIRQDMPQWVKNAASELEILTLPETELIEDVIMRNYLLSVNK